jgi:hypothetical protein
MRIARLHAALFAVAIQCVNAAPTTLECVTQSSDPLLPVTSHQVVFDESSSTVSVDGGTPIKARATALLIEWSDSASASKWHIDRVTGTWTDTQVGGVNNGWVAARGLCTVVTSRKF